MGCTCILALAYLVEKKPWAALAYSLSNEPQRKYPCYEISSFLEAGNIHALLRTLVHAAFVFMQRLCPCTHWQNHIALVAARASYFGGGCIIEREAVAALAV